MTHFLARLFSKKTRSIVIATSPSASTKNFNIAHNFCNIEDSNLIFGMHVYLMELHILSGERSRSSFKVKGHFFFLFFHVYLMDLHILSGEKVNEGQRLKGQKNKIQAPTASPSCSKLHPQPSVGIRSTVLLFTILNNLRLIFHNFERFTMHCFTFLSCLVFFITLLL